MCYLQAFLYHYFTYPQCHRRITPNHEDIRNKSHCLPLIIIIPPSPDIKPLTHPRKQTNIQIMARAIANDISSQSKEATYLVQHTQSSPPSPAVSSLSKLLNHDLPLHRRASVPQSEVEELPLAAPSLSLPQKLGSLCGFSPCSGQDTSVGNVKPEQDTIIGSAKSEQRTQATVNSRTSSAALTTRSKSPAAFLSRKLFPSSEYKKEGNEAFEALAVDPLHGVKSHKLRDEEKDYTSFPAPVFDYPVYTLERGGRSTN